MPIDDIEDDEYAEFLSALDFLDVWNWKSDYQAAELGHGGIRDGMGWLFEATCGDRRCRTGGSNAYPSFANSRTASRQEERFSFLVFAVQELSWRIIEPS